MAIGRVSLVLVVAVALMAAGCGKQQQTADVVEKEPYVIGAIFSTTGDNAPLGVPERETVEMLEKQINAEGGIDGHPVKVEFYDSAGNPQQATQACQQLLADKKVLAIIGPTLSGTSLAIKDACQDAGMPLVSCAASVKIVDPAEPYVFKTAQSDSLTVEKILDYLNAKNIKKVAFINDTNAFGASGREQWEALTRNSGIETVAMESFGTSDTDMTAQLTKIRAKNPEAIVCWGTNPGPAIVAKNAKRLGLKQQLIMSHGVANKKFIELAGSAAEGIVFPAGKLLVANSIPDDDPQKAVLLKYSADFEKAHNKPANTFGGHAWDAFNIVVNAIRKVGPDRAKIREEIEKTQEFVGVSGVFSFTDKEHNGLTKSAFALIKIKDGHWTLAE